MKTPEIINNVPGPAAFRLGLVVSAHSNRAFVRAHCTLAASTKDAAQKALDTEGLDVRWFNEQDLGVATGAAAEALRAKIAAEKYYKKQRIDFLTEYPNLAPILESIIPGSTQDFEVKPT